MKFPVNSLVILPDGIESSLENKIGSVKEIPSNNYNYRIINDRWINLAELSSKEDNLKGLYSEWRNFYTDSYFEHCTKETTLRILEELQLLKEENKRLKAILNVP